ncbi:MAG: hypothetical protein ACRDSN_13970, partial [Pseudonocardiaceae bacterium]
MDNHTTQTTPNAGTTEPVPAPPHQPRRGAARTPRAWLQCLGPTPPGSYLAPTERCLLRTNLHWILPLRTTVKAAAALALTSTLTFLTPGLWWLHTGLWAATLAYH